MIYLDNAATTFPKPQIVAKSIYDSIVKFGGNPGRSGHNMSLKAAEIVYGLREKAANFFGVSDPEQVILTKNCTEALNIAIFSLLKNGGNAIISTFEHNSVVRPLEYLKKNNIADYKIANASFENPMTVLHEFERLIDSKTKAIICTHASNVTGKVAPITELSKICQRKGIIFCVDASQTAGILDVNMQRDGIDILCCPGHKGLYGPTGTGLLIAKKGAKLSPFTFGGTGSVSGSLDMPDFLPDMLESGTVNVVGAAGLAAGIDFLNSIGVKKAYEHELTLAQNLYSTLDSMSSILLYSSYPRANFSVPTLSFNVKGYTCTDVSEYLNRKNIAVRSGLHCAPLAHAFLGTQKAGTVRVSFSAFNNINHVNMLLNALKSI